MPVLAFVKQVWASTLPRVLHVMQEERMGRQTEMELASAELERAQERLASLEREKVQLVQKLADTSGPEGQGGKAPQGAAQQHSATLEESLRTELGLQVRGGGWVWQEKREGGKGESLRT